MKKKSVRSLLALLLATSMAFAAVGCGSENAGKQTGQSESKNEQSQVSEESSSSQEVVESKYPEYLNLESKYPVIKDEYADEITLTAAVLMQDNAGDWEDLWISKYLKDKYNINLEVEYISFANQAERTSLMLNTGELPDMLINLSISTTDIMTYGVKEGIFLQLDQYMDETLTPSILESFTDDQISRACTAPDGHIYTLPYGGADSNGPNLGKFKRILINRAWLSDLGLEMPRTLDEFVDAMYAIKEADPAGVGSENLYPFGSGSEMVAGLGWYILNALGYVEPTFITGDGYGMLPALRDGEAVIPVYDMDVFQEYLKIMNQFYNDGIINPTFFTMEEAEMRAQVVEGKTATYHNLMNTTGIENPDDWEVMYPLTSEWQTEPEIATPEEVTTGNFLVSAKTEYPELCLAFAELFFDIEDGEAAMLSAGAPADSEYVYDYVGRIYVKETNSITYDGAVYNAETGKIDTSACFPEGCTSSWQYRCEYLIGNMWQFGRVDNNDATVEYVKNKLGYEAYEITKKGEDQDEVYNQIYRNMETYATDGYPLVYYLTEEQSNRMTELKNVIEPYVEEQVALFITGRRSLSETEDFKKELEGLGMEELLNLYKSVYDSMK